MQTTHLPPPALVHQLSARLIETLTQLEARYLQAFPDRILWIWSMWRSPYYSAKLLPPKASGVYLTAYFSAGSVHVAFAQFMKNQWSAPLNPEDLDSIEHTSPASFPYDVSLLYWRGVTRDLRSLPVTNLVIN